MYEKNYQELANAVIVYAAEDLRTAYRRRKRNPKDSRARGEVIKLKKFFYSDYFKALSKADGELLFERIINEIDENPTGKQIRRRRRYEKTWGGNE